MPYSFVVDREHRLVISTGSGLVTAEEIVACLHRGRDDSEFPHDFNELVDLREAVDIQVSTQDVKAFVDFRVFSPQTKHALVATAPVTFGMCRLFCSYHEMLRGPEPQFQVFRELPAAIEWLGLPGLTL